jgi:outer membrane protein TolC
MQRALLVAVAAASFVAVPPVTAAPVAEADTLDLAALLEEALAANPEVARARSLWRAAEERVPFEGALENPMLELMLDQQPFEPGLTGERVIGLSQAFPFPGKRGLGGDAAGRDAEAVRATAFGTARSVVAEVKVAYWELVLQESVLATLRESREALRDVVEGARARYETGLGSQQDLLLAMVEKSTLDGEILHAEAVAGAARSRMNLLLARDAEAPLGRAVADSLTPFDARLEDLLLAAREARPSVLAAERDVAAADARHRLSRSAWRPDFVVGAGYLQMPNEPDEWQASLGVELPLWKGSRQDAAAREASRRLDAARSAFDAERLRAAASVEEQYAHVVSEREIVGLYRREILPQAELAYRSARSGYLAGRETFLVLLEALRTHLALRKAYWEYFADSEMHLAWLEEATGRDLGPVQVDLTAALEHEPEEAAR